MTDERTARAHERPWIMRTYSGHSTPEASNALYRANLAKGQTGLSASPSICRRRRATTPIIRSPRRGRQGGRAGASPRRHARALRRDPARDDEHVDDDQRDGARGCWRSTSRSPRSAASIAKLCGDDAERHRQGVPRRAGRTSSRPRRACELTSDTIAYTVDSVPQWNPMNICSYHLQEAGATPVQEIAYALEHRHRRARRGARRRGQLGGGDIHERRSGGSSFFVNAGVRFIEEMCKLRAFVAPLGAARRASATASRTRRRCASATACR